jgi:serine/threonine protein kinase
MGDRLRLSAKPQAARWKIEGTLVERTIFSDRLLQNDTQLLSLGQYHLLEELGRGGMGRVYRALHTIMDRVVALKVISPELVSDPVAVEWFLREVRASTQLKHPNIVMAYDANESKGMYFLVMEYVHGMTLDALVKKQGPLPIAYVCALMRQAALGLQHAHEKGMVHRDIKPGNLLIPTSEGDTPPDVLVKILDFGLARLHGKTGGDTIALRGEAGVLGTPDYIAPEQSRDIHAADIRSDLYSLGCVFYFALAGRVPFPGENAMEKLIKHLMEQPEPLERVRPELPPELVAIVRRLMAKEPAGRCQTPAELVRELEKLPKAFFDDDTIRAATVRERLEGRSLTVAAQNESDSQPQHTCVLGSVKVFAPSCAQAEPSGPSLLEPLCENAPGERCRPDTHDTLTLSRTEDTEEVTAETMIVPDWASAIPDASEGTAVLSVGALPPIDPVVFRLWRRWLGFLETIVVGRGPSHVNSDSYQTIHTLLLQACRAAIDACPIPERRAFYEECLSIAQPWLKLQTFVHADSAMLDSLLQRCRQIEVELNNSKAPWTIRHVFGLVLLALSPAGAALWYWYYGRLWLPSLFKTFDGDFSLSSLQSAWSFLQHHPALLMGVLFPLVIIFSVALLSRTPRA